MNSLYYSIVCLAICVLVRFIISNKVNKYGFSQKDYNFVRKSHYFSKKEEMKSINQHTALLSTFFVLAFLLGYMLIIFSNISSISGSVDLTAKKDLSGSPIIVESYFSIFNYSKAKIGNPACTMTLSWIGIVLVCIFPIYLVMSGIFNYFAYKLYTPKY